MKKMTKRLVAATTVWGWLMSSGAPALSAQEMPADAMATGKASSWNDVPDDQGYGLMRDAIVRHVRALIDTLR